MIDSALTPRTIQAEIIRSRRELSAARESAATREGRRIRVQCWPVLFGRRLVGTMLP